MNERHEHEQYFFDLPTRAWLAAQVEPFPNPCCLCTPTLGQVLTQHRDDIVILDIDERFAEVPGFHSFDLTAPRWLGQTFGVIVCDPPFFKVSLHQLVQAIRMLSQHSVRQPLLVTYLKRREAAFLRAFQAFQLKPTGVFCGYETVAVSTRNAIEVYSNVSLSTRLAPQR